MGEQIVTLDPGESAVVSFEATPTEARVYHVTVDGLEGSFEAIPYLVWSCPQHHVALIAPDPDAGRPVLSVAASLYDVAIEGDAEWFQVLWLDETTGTWLYFHSHFTIGNTLHTLEPGLSYYVIVEAPCDLVIPQEG